MIPIILLSIAALAIILERLWILWKIRLNIPQAAQEIFLDLERGQLQKALERCEKMRHPIGELFKLGISNRTLKSEQLEKMMEREGEEQISHLEQALRGPPRDHRCGTHAGISGNDHGFDSGFHAVGKIGKQHHGQRTRIRNL